MSEEDIDLSMLANPLYPLQEDPLWKVIGDIVEKREQKEEEDKNGSQEETND